MTRLTDEQLEELEGNGGDSDLYSDEILSLVFEVRESRRAMEVSDGASTKYAANIAACPRCFHPLYPIDRQKFCDDCGVRLKWRRIGDD